MSIESRLNEFNWRASVATVTTSLPALDWPALCRIEPQLIMLARRARAWRRTNWRAYEAIKLDLRRLVGWEASNPQLRSSEAYTIAHRHVFGGRRPR